MVAAAKAEEARLNLNGVTRQLIELQLRKANLDPGPPDGKFTTDVAEAMSIVTVIQSAAASG